MRMFIFVLKIRTIHCDKRAIENEGDFDLVSQIINAEVDEY